MQERDHYSQFVSEPFESYVSRKEKDGVHGNNPEMQAASELFNRPIEVYVPERGAIPINIFHGGYRTSNAPIRVSYHGRSHYNAVINPEEASIGQVLNSTLLYSTLLFSCVLYMCNGRANVRVVVIFAADCSSKKVWLPNLPKLS